MTKDEINKLPVPKLKKLAREHGVNPAQPLPKIRAALEKALASSGEEKKKPKGLATKSKKPKGASEKPVGKKGPPAKAKKAAAEEEEESEVTLEAHQEYLEQLDVRLTKVEEFLEKASVGPTKAFSTNEEEDEEEVEDEDDDSEEEETDEEESDEEEDSEDEETEEEESDEEEEESEEEEGEIPESVKPYLNEDGDGLDISPDDVDEMDEDTIRTILNLLGEADLAKAKGIRKLQSNLRGLVADTEEEDSPKKPKKGPPSKAKKSKGLTEVPEEGTEVTYTDDEGEEYTAWIADPDEIEDEGEEDQFPIKFDEESFMFVTLDQIRLA